MKRRRRVLKKDISPESQGHISPGPGPHLVRVTSYQGHILPGPDLARASLARVTSGHGQGHIWPVPHLTRARARARPMLDLVDLIPLVQY